MPAIIGITEELKFSHLNDSQPNLGDEVFICDGTGTYRQAVLCSVGDPDDDDEYQPDDNKIRYWYCEDTDERYAVSDYPFWAPMPLFEFPTVAVEREVTVFNPEDDHEEEEEEEVLEDELLEHDNPTYEIVGSEIRRK